MTDPAPAATGGRDFLSLSRRFLDVLGADGLGSDHDQRQFVVDGIEPSWVLLPATAAEAAEALRLCTAHDLAVVPAGAGYRLGQGSPPERLDAVLSTSRMTAVIEHAAADLTLTVEAGATLAAVNGALRAHGQWLPFDPPRASETTIGGLIAANATGPSRQAFGTVRESLIGVRALCADGTAVKSGGRVVKNVAGYDLQKLLVGSLGTLAVIVEATFKLQPLAEERKLACWSVADRSGIAALATAGTRLADSPLGPRLVEIVIADDRPPLLVAELAGGRESVDDAERRARERLGDLAIESVAGELGEEALRALQEPSSPPADSVVLRAGVRRDALGAWVGAALCQVAPIAAKVRAHAHAGIGIARLELAGVERERLAEVVAELRDDARRTGGYLFVERAPAEWKTAIDVWGPRPAGFELMQGVKAAFDPRRLLSPGRFVGGI